MSKLTVIGQKIIVRPLIDVPEKRKSGLMLPPSINATQMRAAIVFAVGTMDIGINVKVGDRIYFDKSRGINMEYEGENYIILSLPQDTVAIENN